MVLPLPSHLRRPEAEAAHAPREVAAERERPARPAPGGRVATLLLYFARLRVDTGRTIRETTGPRRRAASPERGKREGFFR